MTKSYTHSLATGVRSERDITAIGMPEPIKTEEELIVEIQNAVVEHLNAPAKAKLYDSIQSAALRAGFPGPFHDEGVAFASWMDTCWAKCYELLAEVKGGNRPVMTPEEVVSELPVLILP